MKVQGIFIGMVVFCGLLIGVNGFYSDMAYHYLPSNVTSNISSMDYSYNVSEIINRTDMTSKRTETLVSRIPIVGSITDSFWGFFNAAWNALGVIFEIPLLLMAMVGDVLGVFTISGWVIPGWFLLIISGMITLTIVWFILKFLREGRVD